jgi:hypothetical protein
MFKDTHPHLFNVAGTKDSYGDNTPRVLSGAKAPRLYGTPLDKNHRSKAVEIVRRFRSTVLYLAPWRCLSQVAGPVDRDPLFTSIKRILIYG